MATLPPDFDLAGSKTITRLSIYRSQFKRCRICIIPAIIIRQISENWKQAVTDSEPFTVRDAKSIVSARCGDCSLKGWPKASAVESTLFLHVASNNRRKLK